MNSAAAPEGRILVFDTDALIVMACAAGGMLQLVGSAVGDRARWAEGVRGEVKRKASAPHLACASQVLRARWLGEPVVIDDVEGLVEVFTIRESIARQGDHALEHLGESESIVIARRLGAVLVANDRDARVRAGSLAVPSMTVWELVDQLAAAGGIPEAEVALFQRSGR